MRKDGEENFSLKITMATIIYKNALYAYIFTCRSFFSTMSIVLIYYCNGKFAISFQDGHMLFLFNGYYMLLFVPRNENGGYECLHNNAKENSINVSGYLYNARSFFIL